MNRNLLKTNKRREYFRAYFQDNKEKFYQRRREKMKDPLYAAQYKEKAKHYRLYGTFTLFEKEANSVTN